MKTAEEIAAKIGRAQKRVVLSLSEKWGPSGDHAAAKRLWCRDDIPLLLDHKHMTGDCWSLRPMGMAVKRILEEESRNG